ncbi:hypothetical protein D3C72_565830 [compost metagenome]
MRNIALEIELALLPLRGGRQRYDPEYPGADPLGDRLDGAPLAGTVTPLEDDADLEPLVHYPLLQLHQLHVQATQLLLVCLVAKGLGLGDRYRLFCFGFFLASHDVLLFSRTDEEWPSSRTAHFKRSVTSHQE